MAQQIWPTKARAKMHLLLLKINSQLFCSCSESRHLFAPSHKQLKRQKNVQNVFFANQKKYSVMVE
jgi:hypothetical protein